LLAAMLSHVYAMLFTSRCCQHFRYFHAMLLIIVFRFLFHFTITLLLALPCQLMPRAPLFAH